METLGETYCHPARETVNLIITHVGNNMEIILSNALQQKHLYAVNTLRSIGIHFCK